MQILLLLQKGKTIIFFWQKFNAFFCSKLKLNPSHSTVQVFPISSLKPLAGVVLKMTPTI